MNCLLTHLVRRRTHIRLNRVRLLTSQVVPLVTRETCFLHHPDFFSYCVHDLAILPILLPVKHMLQREVGDCLAACAAMVLNYLGRPVAYNRLIKVPSSVLVA